MLAATTVETERAALLVEVDARAAVQQVARGAVAAPAPRDPSVREVVAAAPGRGVPRMHPPEAEELERSAAAVDREP